MGCSKHKAIRAWMLPADCFLNQGSLYGSTREAKLNKRRVSSRDAPSYCALLCKPVTIYQYYLMVFPSTIWGKVRFFKTSWKIQKTAEKTRTVVALPIQTDAGKALTMFPNGGNTLSGRPGPEDQASLAYGKGKPNILEAGPCGDNVADVGSAI